MGRFKHEEAKSTEESAYEKIGLHAESMREGILRNLVTVGLLGLIPDEFPGLINTVRRRFTDLWVDGLIKQTNRTRLNKNGNEELVWVLGEDPNRRKKRNPAMEEMLFILMTKMGNDSFLFSTKEEAKAYQRKMDVSGVVYQVRDMRDRK